MKLSVLFVMIFLGVLSSNAQIINLKWGGLNDGGDEFNGLFYVGPNKNDSSQIITINDKGQVNLFDSSLNRVQHKELMKLLKGDDILTSFRSDKKWHLFTSATKGELYEAEFDNDAVSIKSTQLLYKFSANGKLQFAPSPDSSKWVFSRIGTVNKKQIIEILVVTNKAKTVYSKQMALSAGVETFSSVVVNNLGATAWIDNDGKYLTVCQLDEKGNERTLQPIPLAAKKMHPAVGTASRDTFMFCVGYNRENINYDCLSVCGLISVASGDVNYKQITIPNCIRNGVPMHIVARDSNKAVIITEEFSNTTTASSNTCKYGSLNAICITMNEGKYLWQKEIFKNLQFVTTPDKKCSPTNPDYSNLFSHNLIIFGNKMMFTYNDNCSNCMRSQQTPRSHAEIRKSCLNLVALDDKGELTRYSNLAEPQSKYTVHPNNTFRLSNNKVVVFGTNSRYMLGQLLLDK